ncbi:MAG TPA: hypothetical protein VEI73_10600 [Candidatus Acidoferrum sp.]|nr:hypothetical protein [Candidatus Acidoferrum sp.]
MTPEELYALWAPQDSVWSPWVLPVPFAQLICPEVGAPVELPQFHSDWVPEGGARDTAIVADLPGADTVYFGLALLQKGYRPIPIIDGSPGPDADPLLPPSPIATGAQSKSRSVVDMRGLLLTLCQGAARLREVKLASDAPPAFLLDSQRMAGGSTAIEGAFDNRWMVFPQDFPSSRFLQDRGIRRVIYVHDTFLNQPAEDLAHILLRWQEDGIVIESKSARFGDGPVPIKVNRPSRFRALWYRALAVLGLRRNDAGGFGGYPPSPSGAG